MDTTTPRGRRLLALCAVLLFSTLLGTELIQEDDLTAFDIFFEVVNILLLVGCTVTVALLVSRVRAQEKRSHDFRRNLEDVRVRNEQWRGEMARNVQELGTAIQRQFTAWDLTRSEQEVGMLLLKGFSHKEIAQLRGTAEATIRQHAASVYQKSGLNGRSGLSAFFLEDLLLPETGPFYPKAAE